MTIRYLTALPVFNEASHVVETLDQVRQYSQDILVVDDGSRDATPHILARMNDIAVVTHPQNRGYGAALKSAFEYALQHEYDLLVTIDCDGQHEPQLIPPMVAAFEGRMDSLDLLSGSRYLKDFPGDSLPPADRRRINQLITQDLNHCLGLQLTDAFCGFKAYRVGCLNQFDISELGYAMPLQLWVQAVAAGMTIEEFPVPLVYLEEERSFGGSLDDARQRLAYYREVLASELELHSEALAYDPQEQPCGFTDL